VYERVKKLNMSVIVFTIYCPTNAHNVKRRKLLKHFKIKKAAPTCFVYKETIIREPQTVYAYIVHNTHVSQVTTCSHNTDVLYELYVSTLNQMYNFSQVLAVAP